MIYFILYLVFGFLFALWYVGPLIDKLVLFLFWPLFAALMAFHWGMEIAESFLDRFLK